MYDRFSGTKFWCNERNTENIFSHLYSNEESDYLRKAHAEIKSFAPS